MVPPSARVTLAHWLHLDAVQIAQRAFTWEDSPITSWSPLERDRLEFSSSSPIAPEIEMSRLRIEPTTSCTQSSTLAKSYLDSLLSPIQNILTRPSCGTLEHGLQLGEPRVFTWEDSPIMSGSPLWRDWPELSTSYTIEPKTDMSRPGFEPMTFCIAGTTLAKCYLDSLIITIRNIYFFMPPQHILKSLHQQLKIGINHVENANFVPRLIKKEKNWRKCLLTPWFPLICSKFSKLKKIWVNINKLGSVGHRWCCLEQFITRLIITCGELKRIMAIKYINIPCCLHCLGSFCPGTTAFTVLTLSFLSFPASQLCSARLEVTLLNFAIFYIIYQQWLKGRW